MNDYFVRLAMRAAGTITLAAPARRMETDVGELGETEVQTEAAAPAEVRAGPIETAPGPIETAAGPTKPVDAPAAPAADREMATAEPRVATATTPPAIAAPSDQANEAAPMETALSATSPRPESIAPPPPVVAVTKNVTQQVIEPRETMTRTVIVHETELRTEERESALPPPMAIAEPAESAGTAGALQTTLDREIIAVAAPAEPRSVTVTNPVINPAAPPPPPGEEISVEVRIGRLDIRPPAPPPAPPPTPAGPEYPRGFAGYERARNYRDRDWY